jgi:1-aminocyclopropane-1-carboxylate deaminase/D-cysteine desulfhydrase-like pyridoxal-dependent ACC family enzyme
VNSDRPQAGYQCFFWLNCYFEKNLRGSTVLEKFERYPLTFGPTPIEKLSRLSEHLGGEVELFAKREDCNSGLAFGGNKVRKLEYIVPDAIRT